MQVTLTVDAKECPYWDFEKQCATHTCRGCERGQYSVMYDSKRICLINVNIKQAFQGAL